MNGSRERKAGGPESGAGSGPVARKGGAAGAASPEAARASVGPVRRRQVFYIPGFDPFPIRRYRELYRSESAAQARISGHDIVMEGVPGAPGRWRTFWRERAAGDAPVTRSDFVVLEWSDIVRRRMAGGVLAGYRALLTTLWRYVASGTFFRLLDLRRGPILAALYPIVMLVAQFLLAVLVAFGLFLGGRWAIGALAAAAGAAPPDLPAAGLALVAALAGAAGLLRWFWKHDGRFYAHYLMHDYAHSCSAAGRYPADLDRRIDAFADAIGRALAAPDVDEVLVVGHSSGAHLAISAVARLLRQGRVPGSGARLALLTLGHVVPMISFLPEARQLRADLALLARADRIFWLDVTAPGDVCTFALCDPVAVSGMAPPGGQIWPRVISAAFSLTLAPERWRKLKWRFFRLHFQYLCAFDRPRGYDYFAITAGPETLADRFAGRPSSPSRIATPRLPVADASADAKESADGAGVAAPARGTGAAAPTIADPTITIRAAARAGAPARRFGGRA